MAFVSFMTFACPDWHFEQVLDAAVRHEYHGIEFRCDARHEHGVEIWSAPDERKRWAKKLREADVFPCCLATSLQLIEPEAVEAIEPRLQLAADLEIPLLRVFCGAPPPGWEKQRVIEMLADHLRAAGDRAAELELTLLLETHDTVSLGADAAEAVRLATHPAIAINYDNLHPYRDGESIERTFSAIGEFVRHCHLHDALNREDQVIIRPFGEGELPMDDMAAALFATGYDGFISGEWFHQQYGPTPDESLERYRADVAALCSRHNVTLAER